MNRPTEMTDRQLAAAIRFGRKVTFETPDLKQKEVTGYVMGFDEDNIRLALTVGGQLRNHTYNRGYIAKIYWHPESTMSSEPLARELEDMVKAVRTRIVNEYFRDKT